MKLHKTKYFFVLILLFSITTLTSGYTRINTQAADPPTDPNIGMISLQESDSVQLLDGSEWRVVTTSDESENSVILFSEYNVDQSCTQAQNPTFVTNAANAYTYATSICKNKFDATLPVYDYGSSIISSRMMGGEEFLKLIMNNFDAVSYANFDPAYRYASYDQWWNAFLASENPSAGINFKWNIFLDPAYLRSSNYWIDGGLYAVSDNFLGSDIGGMVRSVSASEQQTIDSTYGVRPVITTTKNNIGKPITFDSNIQNATYALSGAGNIYPYNSTADFTITPNEGYEISSVTSNSGTITGSDGSYSLLMPKISVTINATVALTDYGITYNLNGGTATNPDTYNINTNTFTLNNPTKTGYEFIGWSGTGIDGISTEVTIPQGSTGAREYTANFEIINYTLTYDLDGGTATNPSTYNVETNTFTLNNPTKTGYTFEGWEGTDITGTSDNVEIAKGSIGNRSYRAIYEANDVRVTYITNGGSDVAPETHKYDSIITNLPTTSKTGYTFEGWFLDEELTNPYNNTVLKGDLTLYAKFSATKYTITYYLDGGTANNPTTYTIETDTFTLNNPTKTGYEFIGWSGTDIEDTSTEVIIPQGSLGNREYTAIFEAEDVPVPDTDSEEGTPAPDTGANSKDTHSADSIISSLFIIMAITIVSGTSVLIIRSRKQRS